MLRCSPNEAEDRSFANSEPAAAFVSSVAAGSKGEFTNSVVNADATVVASASPGTKMNLCSQTSYRDLGAACPTAHYCFTALFSIGDNFHSWCFLQLPVRPN